MLDPLLMYKLKAGLLGTPETYGDTLSPEQASAAQNNGFVNLGASLLAASGPTREPVGLGQAIGGAVLQGRAAQEQSSEKALNALLIKKKLTAPTQKYMNVGQGGAVIDPVTGKIIFQNPAKENKNPSNVDEWEYYNRLPPEDQKRYLEMKRNNQALQLVDVAGGKSILNRSTGDVKPLTTAQQEAAGASAVAGATAGAKVAGETEATAKLDLPRIEDNSRQMLELLDSIENHPGRKIATGASSILQADKIPGTNARDFRAKVDQLAGKQFLEAFNSLKGAGQISEIEGKKATDAISTLQDRGQSEDAYLNAINELRGVVKDATTRARKKAGVTSNQNTPTDIQAAAKAELERRRGRK